MIGNFFSYLYKDAYKYGDPAKGRVSYETATGYASSVKVYYTNKFRLCGPELNVFGPGKWRELHNRLLAQFREETKSTRKALVNGHEASEDTDRNAIAIGCYWLGTVEAAEFLHLNNTMMQCSGRGTEVSLLTKDNIRSSDVNELCYSYKILKVDLSRQKDGPRQSISIYPHRDSVHHRPKPHVPFRPAWLLHSGIQNTARSLEACRLCELHFGGPCLSVGYGKLRHIESIPTRSFVDQTSLKSQSSPCTLLPLSSLAY